MLLFLLYAFIATTVIQLLYFIIFSKFSFAKNTKKTYKNTPVSVLICAKNEAKNLKQNLPLILNQNYSDFEVVLINDASNDDTLDIMESFKEIHSNIKIVNVRNNETFWGNKKYPLTLGIKASSHNHLLFIDADCKPVSNEWILNMSSNFSNSKKIILGYGAYKKKKTILNSLIRFETLLTAIQYFSYAKSGNPYMGVGRNLAYNKDTFFEVNGFMSHMKIRSGDDDLFINQVANKNNTTIEFSENSYTESEPSNSFSEWFTQKRRHISTAKYYKTKDKFLLGIFYFSQLLFWSLFIFLISTQYEWKTVLTLFSIRTITLYIIYGFSAKKLKEKDLIIAFPLLELFLIIFQLTLFLTNSISKPNNWK